MSASNWPLGLSSCGSQDMERAVFQGYAQAGIRYMEVSLDAYRYAALNLDAPKSYAQEAGVRLWSIHLPFNREFYNIAHLDSSRRAACLLEYCRLLEKASKAGISVAVVHPSSEPIDGAERALAMAAGQAKPARPRPSGGRSRPGRRRGKSPPHLPWPRRPPRCWSCWTRIAG